MVTIGLGKKK